MATKCTYCGIRNVKTGSKGSETSPNNESCNYCYEEGGFENQHNDQGHEAIAAEVAQKGGNPATYLTANDFSELESFMSGCWICHPELNLAKLPAKKAATITVKVRGIRRPQLNHKGHNHPQTPAARRACKAAFWVVTPADLTDNSLDQAMAAWDASLDGHGKPVQAPKKATPMTVVPRGPKGGVINQLKASKPGK